MLPSHVQTVLPDTHGKWGMVGAHGVMCTTRVSLYNDVRCLIDTGTEKNIPTTLTGAEVDNLRSQLPL